MKKVFLEMERLRNPFSGLGQFCWHLGKEIAPPQPSPEGREQIQFTIYLPDNQRLSFGENVNYISVSKFHKLFPIAEKYDIWHCLHQDSKYLPKDKNTKLVLTIHDLNFLERNDYSKFRKQLKINELQRKINHASAVTFISKFTKNQVNQHLKIPENVIQKVIYNGNNLESGIRSQELEVSQFFEKFKIKKPTADSRQPKFLFSIGIIQPKKNFHVLLPILQKRKDLIWLIAGDNSDKYVQKIEEVAKDLGVFEQVHFLGKVQESEKYFLYENCEAFLFPSLSEGFGLPVVEAMSFGKPVFLSKLTSLPEIGGDEAYYFDDFSPENVDEIFENGMKDFENDLTKPEKLKNRAAKFSWKKAAEEYLELYLNL